jgi:D-beta-D-heptose 7-phosphate kinase/D-beta-D-heptose 1-phosphate adenosyltransferase
MKNSISAKRAEALFRTGGGRKIVVCGDVMLDQFVWGKVSRISPEAPVPVVEVTNESFHLGGGANVAHNLSSLGAVPVLIGVRGQDGAADRLLETLANTGITEASLIPDASRPTTVKTRTIAHGQQVVRTDRESREDLTPAVETEVIERVVAALRDSQALILSDYSKGTLTPRVLQKAIAAARRRQLPVLVDPKLKRFGAYRRVSVVTPNTLEAQAATGIEIDGRRQLESAARKILSSLQCEALLVTRGEQGMALYEKSKRPVYIGAAAREVFDVTGAGDTVIATAAFVLAAGGKLKEAAVLSNQAAGIVVGKLGTATTTPDEILKTLASN